MDLLSLVAHLTLDTDEYEKAIGDAQKEADKLSIEDYSLNLDNTDFKKSLIDAEGEAENFETNISSVWEGIKTGLVTAGVAAAITGLFNQLSDCVNLAAKLGDNVDKGSKRLNISTDAYQEWSHALNQSGANINDLQRGILSINKLLGGGEVSKSAAEAFERLGISATNAGGGLKTTEQYLADTMKALADFSGTNEERGALVEAIFGHSGNDLNALFESGSKGIDDLINEAHELGMVMTSEQIQKSVDYGDAVSNLQGAIDGLKVSFAEGVLPILTDAVEMVTRIVAFFNGNSTGPSIANTFSATDKALAEDLVTIEETSRAAGTLIDKLYSMGNAEKLTAEQQAEWKATAEWLVNNIPSLSGVIDKDTLSITANKDEVTKLIGEWKALARERAIQAAVESKREALTKKGAEYYEALGEAARLKTEYDAKVSKLENDSTIQALWEEYEKSGGDEEIGNRLASAAGGYSLNKEYEAYVMAQNKVDSLEADYKKGVAEFDAFVEGLNKALDETETASENAADSVVESGEQAIQTVNDLGDAIDELPNAKRINFIMTMNRLSMENMNSNAKGLWNVPYDDYPTLLHRDEMVLSASSARHYRNGDGGISSSDLANLKSAILEAITKGMSGIENNIFLDGRQISQNTSRRLMNDLKARRFGG